MGHIRMITQHKEHDWAKLSAQSMPSSEALWILDTKTYKQLHPWINEHFSSPKSFPFPIIKIILRGPDTTDALNPNQGITATSRLTNKKL